MTTFAETPALLDPTPGDWNWTPQPEAQAFIDELLTDFLAKVPGAAEFAQRVTDHAALRFKDLVGLVLVPDTKATRERLTQVGYRPKPTEFNDPDIHYAFENPLGLFPDILLTESDRMSVGVKVESVSDFFTTNQLPGIERVEGEPLSRARWGKAYEGPGGYAMWVCERHGYHGFGLTFDDPEARIAAQFHLERFRARPRRFLDVGQGFADLHARVDAAVDELGQDWACSLFFRAERDYWMLRNAAGRAQYMRQRTIGLGWANHDHHTYRCARATYPKVIQTFEKLGFTCRERFYAGGEAGWGAQVLEQPITGIVIFADVDMSAEEVEGDFAHDGFASTDGKTPTGEPTPLGTVGLWCALHGESILQAGMHHLEAMFDHHALKTQLEERHGITTMDPFTTFPHLRQAFTAGERWAVDEHRLARCLDKGWITTEEADKFRSEGALGSHLENLERNDGFKGFNQTGVSDIIGRTDARKH